MIYQLLKFKWLQFWRSPTFSQSMVQNVFMGIFGAYFLLNMLVMGFFLETIVQELAPNATDNILPLVVAGLFYYALFDLLMRYFIQKFPVIDLKPSIYPKLVHSNSSDNLRKFLMAKSWARKNICETYPKATKKRRA